MAYRPRGYGLTAEVKRKLESKYDTAQEQEVREWMEAIVGEPLVPGADPKEPLGSLKFHKSLKDGVFLCKLANKIMGEGTCKITKMTIAFKQMENINNFLQACERYGIAKTDLFQTADLFEYTNMWQVILTCYALGRKARAKGFRGPTLGPKEATKNLRNFDEATLNAGQAVIGLQSGTNKLASQKGMAFGNRRHIADVAVESGTQEGHKYIGLQMGTNQVASQKGIAFGAARGIADLHIGESSRASNAVIGLQMGTTKLANQSGMSFGSPRGIADKKHVMEASPESNAMIGLQMGTNKTANQAGMSYGKSRGIVDMRVERPSDQSTINLQMGTNKGASQSGMAFGGRRDINQHKLQATRGGDAVIPLQMGTNKGASQSGMSYGKSRGVYDIRVQDGSVGSGSPTSNRSSVSSPDMESPYRAEFTTQYHSELYAPHRTDAPHRTELNIPHYATFDSPRQADYSDPPDVESDVQHHAEVGAFGAPYQAFEELHEAEAAPQTELDPPPPADDDAPTPVEASHPTEFDAMYQAESDEESTSLTHNKAAVSPDNEHYERYERNGMSSLDPASSDY